MKVDFIESLPKKEDFFELYGTTGWNTPQRSFTEDELFRAIKSSWYMVCAYQESQLAGFGRIVSDGIYQTFICDLIIHPEFQGKGLGKEILEKLVTHCRQNNIKWIQLTCAQGKSSFYEKYGFSARPSDGPGMQLYL